MSVSLVGSSGPGVRPSGSPGPAWQLITHFTRSLSGESEKPMIAVPAPRRVPLPGDAGDSRQLCLSPAGGHLSGRHGPLPDPQSHPHEPVPQRPLPPAGLPLHRPRQLPADDPRPDVLADAEEFLRLGLLFGQHPVRAGLSGGAAPERRIQGAGVLSDPEPAPLDHPGRGRRPGVGVPVPAELRTDQRHPQARWGCSPSPSPG